MTSLGLSTISSVIIREATYSKIIRHREKQETMSKKYLGESSQPQKCEIIIVIIIGDCCWFIPLSVELLLCSNGQPERIATIKLDRGL